jgi:hypothetical protein
MPSQDPFAIISLYLSRNPKLEDRIVQVWYCYLNRSRGKISPVFRRKVTAIHHLTTQQKNIYQKVLRYDVGALRILIRTSPYSGRSIYQFLTKFTPKSRVSYTILDRDTIVPGFAGEGRYICLDTEYKRQVRCKGKQFFDCFARGVLVHHECYGRFSLCQMMFYHWANEICFFSAMKLFYEEFLLFRSKSFVPNNSSFLSADFELHTPNIVDFGGLLRA